MLRADPDSTTSMPRGMMVIAGLLLILRVVAELTPERARPDLVAWRDPLSAGTSEITDGRRPILYYYAADWCRPCRRLDTEIFHDAEVAAYVNARFVPVRVMASGEAAAGRSPAITRLMELHRVRSFPTLVIERSGAKPLVLEGYPGRRVVLDLLHSTLPAGP